MILTWENGNITFADAYNIYVYSSIDAGVAELADAPDLGSGGRPWGFESLHPHKTLQNKAFEKNPLEKSRGFFVTSILTA